MNRYFKIAAFAFVLFSLPILVFASFPNFTGPLVTCSANPISVPGSPTLPECRSFCDLLATAKNIIDVALTYVIFIVAPAVFIWGGVLIAMSGANPGRRSQGMGYIKGMAIALLIIVGSYVIVNTFIKYVGIQGGFIQGFGDEIKCDVPAGPTGMFLIPTAHAANISVTLPGTSTSTNPIDLIVAIYRFLLGISGFLAISVIIYGAVKYAVSAGSASGLGEAKDWIIAALSGLALLAGAYIILRTINPELTILGLPTINPIILPNPTTGGNSPLTPGAGSGKYGYQGVAIPAGTYSDANARAILAQSNITINRPTDCTSDGQTACTSLDGIKKEAIDGMLQIRKECPKCQLVVTGGTEAGHKSHCIGHANLDVRLDPSKAGLNNFIVADVGSQPPPYKFVPGNDGRWYYLEGDHWHINFDDQATQTSCGSGGNV